MRMNSSLLAGALAGTLTLSGCATTDAGADEAAATIAPSAAPEQSPGPALWKVADDDTTIYLFGTVHALPKDIDWYSGAVEKALSTAQTLVTEIPPGAMEDPAMQARFQTQAMLPAGESLRDKLSEDQRATYEAALAKLGMPANAFDRVKPWFAAVTLGVLPLVKGGYTMENGVETAIEGRVDMEVTREALETVEDQLAAFDSLPMESQVDYLIQVSEQIGEVVPLMQEMVVKWSKGDADGLAALLNEEMRDPVLAEALLYKRNRNWAAWIEDRLDRPGTVFIAVGAGHLAGTKSVQDYLSKDGVESQRVQ